MWPTPCCPLAASWAWARSTIRWPWSTLNYDKRKGGYVINIDKDKLKNAPSIDRDTDFTWTADYGLRPRR